jgi:hypothetical protein
LKKRKLSPRRTRRARSRVTGQDETLDAILELRDVEIEAGGGTGTSLTF